MDDVVQYGSALLVCIVIISIALVPFSYILVRIVSTAFFNAKREYLDSRKRNDHQ